MNIYTEILSPEGALPVFISGELEPLAGMIGPPKTTSCLANLLLRNMAKQAAVRRSEAQSFGASTVQSQENEAMISRKIRRMRSSSLEATD